MDGQSLEEQLMDQTPHPEGTPPKNKEIFEQHHYDVHEIIQVEQPPAVLNSQVLITPDIERKSLDTSSDAIVRKSFNTPHNSYTVAFKITVLDWYHANGENKSHTSKQFGVDRKRIRDWVQCENHLRAMPLANRMRRKTFAQEGKSYGKRPPGSEQLDQAVLNWYKEQRALGRVVYSRLLRAKALELGPQCGLPETFKASAMWLQRWKKRHAVHLKEVDGHKEESRTDGVDNITIPTDFEDHLQQLEQVSAHLTDGQDDDLALRLVSGTNEVSISESGLHIDSTTINQGCISLSESGASDSTNAVLSPQTTSPGYQYQLEAIEPLNRKIREQDQWVGIVEQTVESLETEFSKKIDHVKLVIQQFKSVQEQIKHEVTSLNLSPSGQAPVASPGAKNKSNNVPLISTPQST